MPESLLDQLRGASEDAPDPRLDLLEQVQVMQPEDSLAFSCRGCGDKCCTTDTPIMLSIPEVWRMTWEILRTPGMAQMFQRTGLGATVAFLGHSSGLPVQQLNRLEDHCVFLTQLGDTHSTENDGLYGCAIHTQRPNTCRVFPLGRIMAFEADGLPMREEFVLASRCPGFDAAAPGETVIEGYSPPSADQSVADWVGKNLPAENRKETGLAFGIFKRFMDKGVHAPTEDKPNGKLDARFVMSVLLRLLYVPPTPPSDPELDHPMIMARLEVLRDVGPEIALDAYQRWQRERVAQ